MTEYRIVLNPQSKGSLGKSFFLEPLTNWYAAHQIEWAGADLDDRHRTFSSRHPNEVKSYTLGNEIEAKDTFLRILRGVLREKPPVFLIDTRAQADALVIGALRELNFLELAKAEKTRLTFLLFPIDDNEAMNNLRAVVEFGRDGVDYLIINNPAKHRSRLFTGSMMHRYLLEFGAGEITLPAVTPTTLQIVEKIERQQGRSIGFAEAAANKELGLDPLVSGELSYFLSTVGADLNRVASILAAQKIAEKVQPAAAPAIANVSAPALDWANAQEDLT
jgi:hypothetical protein